MHQAKCSLINKFTLVLIALFFGLQVQSEIVSKVNDFSVSFNSDVEVQATLPVDFSARPEIIFNDEVEVSRKKSIAASDIVVIKFPPNFRDEDQIELVTFLDTEIVWRDTENQMETRLKGEELARSLGSALEKNSRVKNFRVLIKVPRMVHIVKTQDPKSIFSVSELQRKVAQRLFAQCSTCQFEIRITSAPNVKGSGWNLDLRKIEIKPNLLIPIMMSENTGNTWLGIQLLTTDQVVVAKNEISFGESFEDKNLELKNKDITFLPASYHEIGQLKGSKSIRSFRAGEIISKSGVKLEPLIHRSANVKASVGTDDFEVMIELISEQEGHLGDRIRLKNPATGKVLTGEVIEKDRVKIE